MKFYKTFLVVINALKLGFNRDNDNTFDLVVYFSDLVLFRTEIRKVVKKISFLL